MVTKAEHPNSGNNNRRSKPITGFPDGSHNALDESNDLMSSSTVPGRSACQLASVTRFLTFIGIGFALIGAALVAIDAGRRAPLQIVGFVFIICALVVLSVRTIFWLVAHYREIAEVRNGYTTLPRVHQDVEERDWRTQCVVRFAGEPFLSKEERSERLSEAKEPMVGFDKPPLSGRSHQTRFDLNLRRQRPYAVAILVIIFGVCILSLTVPALSFLTAWVPH